MEQVQDWLLDSGVDAKQLEYSSAKDWIKVTLPVLTVEHLLDTNYSIYKHEDGSYLIRTPQWSLPQHLHQYIETIQPTNSFMRPKAKRSTVMKAPVAIDPEDINGIISNPGKLTVTEACNVTAVTPDCLRTLYGKQCLLDECGIQSLILG